MSDDQGMRSTRRNKRKGQFSLPKDEEHLEERYIDDDIGRGVFTTKTFSKGDFLLEYKGELISQEEGYIREKNYPDDLGSFLFFFQQGNASLCVDATYSDGLGRLVNDAEARVANCLMKRLIINSQPHLAIYAKRDLCKNEELRYDYGVKDLPWRIQKDRLKHKREKFTGLTIAEKANESAKDQQNEDTPLGSMVIDDHAQVTSQANNQSNISCVTPVFPQRHLEDYVITRM
ncbi:N-lysine methyltransferase KMT5A-A-like [Dendronephthya gigantea]|uniref:N-lysine methyltransferase KMT5A-A-like n=1 Tax=Dendronephthya gigantea TaxID=151771 RepID=UPI00106D2AB3|nr:N-lysine methyltransferase KMT5A-A-like [Dendronephthya gigantea]